MRSTAGLIGGAAFGHLLGGVPLALAVMLVQRAAVALRRRGASEPEAIDIARRLLVLCGAGVPLLSALERAGEGSSMLIHVTRQARRVGLAPALAGHSGEIGQLLRLLARTSRSGASPVDALRSFVISGRRSRQTARMEKVRRLPVRLMIPMALLLLPGFVLMVYGPLFVESVSQLLGPLGP